MPNSLSFVKTLLPLLYDSEFQKKQDIPSIY